MMRRGVSLLSIYTILSKEHTLLFLYKLTGREKVFFCLGFTVFCRLGVIYLNCRYAEKDVLALFKLERRGNEKQNIIFFAVSGNINVLNTTSGG